MTRRAWLAASWAVGFASLLIAVSGGFMVSVGGVRISARSWPVSAAAAGIAAVVWLWLAWRARAINFDLQALGSVLEARGRLLAAAIAGFVLVAAIGFSSFSATGADASGYLSQAAMWATLVTRVPDPLVLIPDWPLPAGGTAPLGWRAALEPGWQVPTYAPGLPWLMAVPHALAGTTGAVLVVIASAGVAVWATSALAGQLTPQFTCVEYAIRSRGPTLCRFPADQRADGGSTQVNRGVSGGLAALIAAALVATSPTFLYHAFQPMSDVPVTAAWIGCWLLVARGAPAGAGLAAAIAVLVRPNLAPLTAVPWVVTILDGGGVGRWGRAIRFATPVAIAALAIGALQWQWYGSPLRSGYGTAGDLFTLANVGTNARLYAAWLWESEPAFVLGLGLAMACAGAGLRRDRDALPWRAGPSTRSNALLRAGLVCFSIGVALAYFVYAVFEVWSYLRFLLPALACTAALIGASTARAASPRRHAWGGAAVLVVIAMASAIGLHTARRLGVFQVAEVTARAREAGDRLARMLPPQAVLLAGEQSGSMRYATGRPVIRWEGLDARALRAVLGVLAAEGLEAWWVLDQFEEPGVRARFPDVPAAALDWLPEVEAGPLMRTRAWRIPPLRIEAAPSVP